MTANSNSPGHLVAAAHLVAAGCLVATILTTTPAHSAPPTMPPGLQKALGRLSARLVRRGLPTDLLESKAREGLVKHVPPDRIALVLKNLAGFMVEGADHVARRWPKVAMPADLARAYAEARLAGLSQTQGRIMFARIRSPKGWPKVVAALDLTSDLVGAGYPAHAAAVLSVQLLKSQSRIRPRRVMDSLTWLVKTRGLTKALAITRLLKSPDHLNILLIRRSHSKTTKHTPRPHGHRP